MAMQSLSLHYLWRNRTRAKPQLIDFSACPEAEGDAGAHSDAIVGLNRLRWKFSAMQEQECVEKRCQLQITSSASYADLTFLNPVPQMFAS